MGFPTTNSGKICITYCKIKSLIISCASSKSQVAHFHCVRIIYNLPLHRGYFWSIDGPYKHTNKSFTRANLRRIEHSFQRETATPDVAAVMFYRHQTRWSFPVEPRKKASGRPKQRFPRHDLRS